MGKQMRMVTRGERLLHLLARVLPPDERTVVLGDLQEDDTGLFSSMAAVIGYAVRRELTSWRHLSAWLVLLTVVTPCAVMLGSISLSLADGNAIYVWIFANNSDAYLLHQQGFWHGLGESLPALVLSGLALISWSWCCGTVIGVASRSTMKANRLLLCLFFMTLWIGWRPPTGDLQALHLARDFSGNAGVFKNSFYRTFFAPLIQIFFVITPLLCGFTDKRPSALGSPWAFRAYWVLVGTSLASLMAESSLWWQMRTWSTFPPLTPHLPSVLPLALTGCIAYLLAKSCSRFHQRVSPPVSICASSPLSS